MAAATLLDRPNHRVQPADHVNRSTSSLTAMPDTGLSRAS
jgi:hypothetical protein